MKQNLGSFQIVRNSIVNSGKALRCKVYHGRLTLSKRSIKTQGQDSFLTVDGYFSTRSKLFKRRVREHLQKPTKFIGQNFHIGDKKDMEALANLFQAVLAMVRMNTAPSNYPLFIKTIGKAGGLIHLFFGLTRLVINIQSLTTFKFFSHSRAVFGL